MKRKPTSPGENGHGPPAPNGTDPADWPRYTYADAARATRVPKSTIAAWVRGMHYGRGYFRSVIDRPDPADSRLSFNNLIEVNSLRALRVGDRETSSVKLRVVRQAIEQAKDRYGIARPLLDPQLMTSGGAIFLDLYLKLVELSPSLQLAMRAMMADNLRRVRQDVALDRRRFYPEPLTGAKDWEPILVSPYIAFGNAVLERTGISIYAIVSRLNVGETRAELIEDYRLEEAEFEEAVRYAAAA